MSRGSNPSALMGSVMNARGNRVAALEFYRALLEIEPICDAMLIEQRVPAAVDHTRSVLLVVLRGRALLDGALTARVRRHLVESASASHVPDLVVQVAELPYTLGGHAA